MLRDATFHVSVDGVASAYFSQQSGIRQGCPLSPYLFIIAMTALAHDVNAQLSPNRKRLLGAQSDTLLYADDTVLYSNDPNELNTFLAPH